MNNTTINNTSNIIIPFTVAVSDGSFDSSVINSTAVTNESFISQTTAANMSFAPEGEATRFDECNPIYTECQVQLWWFYIWGLLFYVASIVGCVLTVAVMRRPALKKSASSLVIVALALSDTMAVMTGLTRHLILKFSGVDVRKLSAGSCKAQRFFLYWSLDTSAWLLAVLSFERFLAVWKPHLHNRMSGQKRAIIAIAVVAGIQALFNVHVLVLRGRQTIEVGNQTVVLECGYTSPANKDYWANVYNIWSIIQYCGIPTLAMVVFNSLTIFKLCRRGRHLAVNNSIKSKTSRMTSSMTKMLLTVTCYFVFVTFPSTIFSYYQDSLFHREGAIPEHRYAKLELADAILTMMLYMNHSANFFLYCLSGQRYRREVKALLRSWFCKGKPYRTTVPDASNGSITEAQRRESKWLSSLKRADLAENDKGLTTLNESSE